mmetsp:Transcript_72172/g.191758  ORF Transcript_72172/g.191758 Transcript_72172/m.191758 type:complete len:243 (-) Transcript_72172:625-1353(-)
MTGAKLTAASMVKLSISSSVRLAESFSSIFTLYSGASSTMRHLLFRALLASLLRRLETHKALTARMSSMVLLQSRLSVATVRTMRMNRTSMRGSPLLIASASRFTLARSLASKSSPEDPLTRTNSSRVTFTQMVSFSPESMQLAQMAAAALISPIRFIAAYSCLFMPLSRASFFACLRHSFRSPSHCCAGFISRPSKKRLMMLSSSSLSKPEPRFPDFRRSLHSFFFCFDARPPPAALMHSP